MTFTAYLEKLQLGDITTAEISATATLLVAYELFRISEVLEDLLGERNDHAANTHQAVKSIAHRVSSIIPLKRTL